MRKVGRRERFPWELKKNDPGAAKCGNTEIPCQEIKDLLFAAGDGSQSFHNSTRSLPCSLSGRSKKHLRPRALKDGIV